MISLQTLKTKIDIFKAIITESTITPTYLGTILADMLGWCSEAVDRIDSLLPGLREDVDKNAVDIALLQDQANELDNKISDVEISVSEEAQDRANADATLAQSIDKNAVDIALLQDQVSELDNRISDVAEKVTNDIEESVNALREQMVMAVEVDDETGDVSLLYDEDNSSLADAYIDQATGEICIEQMI